MVSLKCNVSGRFLGLLRLLRRETQGRNISPYLADNRASEGLFQAIGFSGKKEEALFARCEEGLHHRTSQDKQKHRRSDAKGHSYPFAGPVIPMDRPILKGILFPCLSDFVRCLVVFQSTNEWVLLRLRD